MRRPTASASIGFASRSAGTCRRLAYSGHSTSGIRSSSEQGGPARTAGAHPPAARPRTSATPAHAADRGISAVGFPQGDRWPGSGENPGCGPRVRGPTGAAPGLRVGRGLKHLLPREPQRREPGCARPSGRARIETRPAPRKRATASSGCARPSGRARIETSTSRWAPSRSTSAAPGLRVGRGLKRGAGRAGDAGGQHAAPGLRVGRGLKHQRPGAHHAALADAAPGLRVGRGLKQRERGRCERGPLALRPAFGSGED